MADGIITITDSDRAQQQSNTATPSFDSFRLLIDAVVDCAVFLLDPGGLITSWNLGAVRIHGYQPYEVVGKNFSLLYPPEAVEESLPAREITEATKFGHYENEGWRLHKDGSKLWAATVITAIRDSEGALLGFGKVIRDLTARRLGEEALHESTRFKAQISAGLAVINSHLTSVLNASVFNSIIATDLEGLVTTFNSGAEAMLGYTSEEIIGKHTPLLFHLPQEIQERTLACSKALGRPVQGSDIFRATLGDLHHVESEWTYRHKDGHTFTVSLSLSVILGESQEPIGYLSVAQDVTQPRRVARQLAHAYDQLNVVMDSTSEGVIQVSRDWAILYGNRKASESLPDFQLGADYWTCFPALRSSPVETALQKAMTERVETAFETHYEHCDTWYRCRVFPTGDGGISIFFTDFTSERSLQNELAMDQLMREKRIVGLSHMAGGLAHEISNPLAIIHAHASDLYLLTSASPLISAEEVRRVSETIVATSNRAARILRGLKGFGREAGNDPMEWASLHDIADQCLELYTIRCENHSIGLKVDLPDDLPPLLCREVQIGQILTNLLNNSLDAIVQSGAATRWISFSAEGVGTAISITVADSGPGIDMNLRPQLMNPFFTTKAVGTGIGLSLSRAIAESHGGTLTLLDHTEHTTFRLVLPLEPNRQPATPPTEHLR